MIRIRTIVCFLLALILAATLLQFWQLRVYPQWLYAVLGATALIGTATALRYRIGADIAAASIGILFAVLAIARTTPVPFAGSIDAYADGQTVTIEGSVAERPDFGVTQTSYVVDLESVEFRDRRIPIAGKVLLKDRGTWPRVPYGGRLRATGKIRRPSSSADFRYDLFLSAQNIRATMTAWSIEALPGNHGNPVLATLGRMRDHVEATIQRLYGEPDSSLAMGLLTGARAEMPEDFKAELSVTGLTHLVAISGFNITLLLTIIEQALFWLPHRYRLIPGMLAVTAFTLFVGAGASVVRASVMGILGMLAAHSGRVANPRLMILWALALMILWNPRQLWYDPGFHLSFLALIGIAEISPLLDPLFKKISPFLGIREALQLSLSAQIITAPWSAFLFGRISLIAPVSNLLAPPLVPIAMLLGSLSVAASWIDTQLAGLVAGAAFLPLHGIVMIVRIFAKIPFASFPWDAGGVMTAMVYGGIAAWVVVMQRRRLE